MSRRFEGPASGRALIICCLLLAYASAGCAVGGGGSDDRGATDQVDESGLPGDLAEIAQAPTEPAPADPATNPVAGAPTSTAKAPPQSATPPSPPRPAPTSAAPSTTIKRTTVLSARDASGDQGLGGPAYADLVGLTIETGGGRVRITVAVAGTVPSAFTGREVVGAGVDIYEGASLESSYQLFADGGESGWRAFLQGPDGFIDYPGTFEVGDTRLVFEVPETALPAVNDLSFAVFLDRSSGTTPRVVTEDHLPDRGTLRTGSGATPS